MTDFVDTWIKIIQADLAQQKKYGYSDFDGPETLLREVGSKSKEES